MITVPHDNQDLTQDRDRTRHSAPLRAHGRAAPPLATSPAPLDRCSPDNGGRRVSKRPNK